MTNSPSPAGLDPALHKAFSELLVIQMIAERIGEHGRTRRAAAEGGDQPLAGDEVGGADGGCILAGVMARYSTAIFALPRRGATARVTDVLSRFCRCQSQPQTPPAPPSSSLP